MSETNKNTTTEVHSRNFPKPGAEIFETDENCVLIRGLGGGIEKDSNPLLVGAVVNMNTLQEVAEIVLFGGGRTLLSK